MAFYISSYNNHSSFRLNPNKYELIWQYYSQGWIKRIIKENNEIIGLLSIIVYVYPYQV